MALLKKDFTLQRIIIAKYCKTPHYLIEVFVKATDKEITNTNLNNHSVKLTQVRISSL